MCLNGFTAHGFYESKSVSTLLFGVSAKCFLISLAYLTHCYTVNKQRLTQYKYEH